MYMSSTYSHWKYITLGELVFKRLFVYLEFALNVQLLSTLVINVVYGVQAVLQHKCATKTAWYLLQNVY